MTREEAKKENKVTCCMMSDDLIDSIYDDFESRTCENCKYLIMGDHISTKCMSEDSYVYLISDSSIDSFGCNKFERKTDEKS